MPDAVSDRNEWPPSGLASILEVSAEWVSGQSLPKGRGKSELRRAVCPVIRGPERDGKCHRKNTAGVTPR